MRTRHPFIAALTAAAITSAACSATSHKTAASGATTSSSEATTSTSAGVTTTTTPAAGGTNPKAVPIGDGKVSTSPTVGSVYSCQTSFGGGGAFTNGPWISGTTWDSTAKIHVQGSVSWSSAAYSAKVSGQQRVITTNDLPVGHTSGTFPIQSSDPAYQYDRNPNSISARSVSLSLPANPAAAAQPSCVAMGAIGVLDDGVYLFNALDGGGRDAAAHEVLDSCDGHPERSGAYHHHTIPSCLVSKATGSSTLVGYVLDGFGIYVERGADGNLLTNADLDACHGRTSTVTWDGQQVSMYHYVATVEYPYTVGCYRGAPVSAPR